MRLHDVQVESNGDEALDSNMTDARMTSLVVMITFYEMHIDDENYDWIVLVNMAV